MDGNLTVCIAEAVFCLAHVVMICMTLLVTHLVHRDIWESQFKIL